MTRRLLAVAGAMALQLITLVLAHELIFLVRFGSRYGEALVHAGHGETWSAAVASSVLLAVTLAALATARLLYMASRLRARGTRGSLPAVGMTGLLRTWAWTAVRIGCVGVALLTIQENVEHAAMGLSAPGPGILLSPEYPFGLWIVVAVSAAVAFVATLFQQRERVLLARLRAAWRLQGRPPASPAARRRLPLVRAPQSILGRCSGLRAPPASAAA